MDEPLAVALKFGFLAVLYLFLLWVARSSMRDLARYERRARPPSRSSRRGPSAARARGARAARRRRARG